MLGSETYQSIILNQLLELENKLIRSVQGKTVPKLATVCEKVTKRQRRRGKTIHKLAGTISLEALENISSLKRQLLDIQKGLDCEEMHNLTQNTPIFTNRHLSALNSLYENINDSKKKSILQFARGIVNDPQKLQFSFHILKSQDLIFLENPNFGSKKEMAFVNIQREVISKIAENKLSEVYVNLELINSEINELISDLLSCNPFRPLESGLKTSQVCSMY